MVTLRNVFFPERQTERETLLTMSMNELTNSTFEIVYRIYNDLIFFFLSKEVTIQTQRLRADTTLKWAYNRKLLMIRVCNVQYVRMMSF